MMNLTSGCLRCAHPAEAKQAIDGQRLETRNASRCRCALACQAAVDAVLVVCGAGCDVGTRSTDIIIIIIVIIMYYILF